VVATLTNTRGDITYASFPIVKWEEQGDTLYVYGKASTPEVDTDEQVVSSAFSAKALRDWLDIAPTLRVQHNGQRDPAGSGVHVEIDRDGDGAHWVKSAVDEPIAKMLVKKGHLRAYSVGIARPVVERDVTGKARGGVVTGGTIVEVSLVDSPANRSCFLEIAKAASNGDAEFTGKMFGDYGDLDFLAKSDAAKVPDQNKADGKPGKPEADDAQDEDVEEQEDDNDDGEKPEDTHKSYAAARAGWMAREPKAPPTDIGSGTAFLAKQAAVAAWEAWDVEGAQSGLDGTAAGYQTWLGKRNMDPNVGGGGVDRDAMDARDFIDPEGRRFPIHSPGDVSDAVSSYGRAEPLIPMRRFKARLKAITRRKGPEFVAALPESWSQKDFTLASPNAEGLVPYNLQGQQKPFRHDPIDDSDGDGDDDEKTDMMEADLTKAGAGKSCKNCGKTYHADAKMRRCENCGKKLPKATVTKAAGLKCFKCGASNEAGARRCADCGKKLPKMLGKAAQALLTKAGIHNWKHGWVWVGAGPNPRLHEHMAAHHEAMSKGKFAEAASHLHAASMVANSDHKKELADRLMAHAGEITSGAPAKSGKMTAAEKKLHQHLAAAHHAAASPSKMGMEHHLSEATAQRQRLERRHGGTAASAGERRPAAGSTYDAAQARADIAHSHRVEQELRAEWAANEATAAPTKRTPTTAARAGEIAARHFAEAREQRHAALGVPTKPEKGLGHDSFGGRSRAAWQGEARRAGVKPRRGAPAHEIAGAVGEHHARQAAIAAHGGDTHRMGMTQDQFVQGAVADFRTRHDAKVGRLGDPTGMGIYPTTAGNQTAHDVRQAREAAVARTQQQLAGAPPMARGIGAFSTDPKVRRSALAQARQHDEAVRAAANEPSDSALARRAASARFARQAAGDTPIDSGPIGTPPITTPPIGHGPIRAVPGSQQARDEAARGAVSQGRGPKKSARERAAALGITRIKSNNGGIMAKHDTTAVEAEAADAPTYTAQRMHDALCPAYDWPAVTKAYPTLHGVADAVDPGTFDLAVLKAADDGDATGVVYAGILHDNADLIAKGHIEPALLADARADLAKNFGPPPDPADYQRGYITAGHATMTAPATRIPMVPPTMHTIDPDDFHRGLITEGHEADSPSNRGDNNPTGSTASGMARSLYATASRAAAVTTMKALHDHLMDTFPGMCQMAQSRPVMPADMQATNRPHPTDPAAIAYASKSADYDDEGNYDDMQASPVPAGLTHKQVGRLVKGAVAKATKTIHKRYRRELDALREELDELGAQPDPTAAPIRGAVTIAKSAAEPTAAAVPVERVSLVEQAQLSKAAADNEYIAWLQKAAGSDNPSLREQAEGVLAGLLTKTG
jgi:hypothetical protein